MTAVDGRRIWISSRMVNMLDDPDVAGVVVNMHDATHRKEAEQDLAHQSFHDALTGLPNRAFSATASSKRCGVTGAAGSTRSHLLRPRLVQGRQRQPRPRGRGPPAVRGPAPTAERGSDR